MSKNKISVVIPVFNRMELLRKTLNSLAQQTYDINDFEIIVIDDGSKENILNIIEEFKIKSKISILYEKQNNQGPAIARNKGIQLAKYDIIALLDSDVIAHKHWLKNVSQYFENNQVQAIEGKTIVPDKNMITPFTHQTENLSGGRYPTCNFIFRKGLNFFSKSYKSNFREDSDFAFTILSKGHSIQFAKDVVVYHPVLKGTLLTPIKLAMRYQYDPILKNKFPMLYKYNLDRVQLFSFNIPHFRKKIYLFMIVTSILLIFSNLTNSLTTFALFIWFISITLNTYIHARQTPINLKNFPTLACCPILAITIPFVLYFALLKGHISLSRNHG